ncbi:hypothetical protein niasHS_014093 [Heterodera schachtii]|uniref:ABC transporter domain-containing protein n=1 Tax=Heterodera schachtii TaxID=97005 RepID=A0ABD2IQR2_HETSC
MDYGVERKRRRLSNYGATSPTKSVQEVKPVELSCHGLTAVHAKSGRKILDDASGMADAGQLVALTGDGGVGKTTLLNTLLNHNLKTLSVEGQMLINAHSLGRFITCVIGYVQQDDLFTGTPTVKEHLMAQAQLRMVGHTQRTMRRRVNELEEAISDGEARRLPFAFEPRHNPQIIFALQPTKDPGSSMVDSVVSHILRTLNLFGRRIVVTIHRPSEGMCQKFERNRRLFRLIESQQRVINRLTLTTRQQQRTIEQLTETIEQLTETNQQLALGGQQQHALGDQQHAAALGFGGQQHYALGDQQHAAALGFGGQQHYALGDQQHAAALGFGGQQQHPLGNQQQHPLGNQQQHPLGNQQQHPLGNQQQHPLGNQQQHALGNQQHAAALGFGGQQHYALGGQPENFGGQLMHGQHGPPPPPPQ